MDVIYTIQSVSQSIWLSPVLQQEALWGLLFLITIPGDEVTIYGFSDCSPTFLFIRLGKKSSNTPAQKLQQMSGGEVFVLAVFIFWQYVFGPWPPLKPSINGFHLGIIQVFEAEIICLLLPDCITVEDVFQGNIIYQTMSSCTHLEGSCAFGLSYFLSSDSKSYLLVCFLSSYLCHINCRALQRIWCLQLTSSFQE